MTTKDGPTATGGSAGRDVVVYLLTSYAVLMPKRNVKAVAARAGMRSRGVWKTQACTEDTGEDGREEQECGGSGVPE